MTRFAKAKLECGCGNTFDVVYYASINTWLSFDFAPSLINQLINGTLYNFKCEKCGNIHHISTKIIINCPKGMFTVSTDEEPEKLNKILTEFGVLDKNGNVVDGFTEMLEKKLKFSSEHSNDLE